MAAAGGDTQSCRVHTEVCTVSVGPRLGSRQENNFFKPTKFIFTYIYISKVWLPECTIYDLASFSTLVMFNDFETWFHKSWGLCEYKSSLFQGDKAGSWRQQESQNVFSLHRIVGRNPTEESVIRGREKSIASLNICWNHSPELISS